MRNINFDNLQSNNSPVSTFRVLNSRPFNVIIKLNCVYTYNILEPKTKKGRVVIAIFHNTSRNIDTTRVMCLMCMFACGFGII